MTSLSILIPAFNEERTLATLLNRVLAADTAGVEKELIVVDNASSALRMASPFPKFRLLVRTFS